MDQSLGILDGIRVLDFGQWTGTLVVGAEQPEMQPRDTSLQFLKRLATAIDDLDALDAKW